MRLAIVLSLILAILAVIFALQNPGFTDVNVGPWEIHGSTALILMVTFGLGVLVGILATVPNLVHRGRRVRKLEKQMVESPGTSSYSMSSADTGMDYTPSSKDL